MRSEAKELPEIVTKFCAGCKETKSLNDFNFRKSGKEAGRPLSRCKKCARAEFKIWWAAHPGYSARWNQEHPGYSVKRSHLTGRSRSMELAKDCSIYLGVVVAERALSQFFDHIIRMPIGNPGYDFICGQGYKIDVKSSCLRHRKQGAPRWQFTIKENVLADYFLCLAFDSRESLRPMHVWLISKADLHNRTGVSVTNTHAGLAKFLVYERPLDRVLACCSRIDTTKKWNGK